jgi:hypothetical protein
VYPGRHIHINEPIVLKQLPFLHGPEDDVVMVHSSMSIPHRGPVKPGWQEHINEPKMFWHSPPFIQGFITSLEHSSMSNSQNSPMYPCKHLHTTSGGGSPEERKKKSRVAEPLPRADESKSGSQVALFWHEQL